MTWWHLSQSSSSTSRLFSLSHFDGMGWGSFVVCELSWFLWEQEFPEERSFAWGREQNLTALPSLSFKFQIDQLLLGDAIASQNKWLRLITFLHSSLLLHWVLFTTLMRMYWVKAFQPWLGPNTNSNHCDATYVVQYCIVVLKWRCIYQVQTIDWGSLCCCCGKNCNYWDQLLPYYHRLSTI